MSPESGKPEFEFKGCLSPAVRLWGAAPEPPHPSPDSRCPSLPRLGTGQDVTCKLSGPCLGLLNSYVLVRFDYKLCGNQMEFIGRLSGAQRIGREQKMKSGTRPETRRLLEA